MTDLKVENSEAAQDLDVLERMYKEATEEQREAIRAAGTATKLRRQAEEKLATLSRAMDDARARGPRARS